MGGRAVWGLPGVGSWLSSLVISAISTNSKFKDLHYDPSGEQGCRVEGSWDRRGGGGGELVCCL